MPEQQQQTDRERDAEIAVRLFGWQWLAYRWREGIGGESARVRALHPPSFPPDTPQWRKWVKESQLTRAIGDEPLHQCDDTYDAFFLTPVPSYHTDPAAVFGPGGLVDAMEKKGYEYTMTNECGGHQCSFYFAGGRDNVGFADTPTRAVALAAHAALKAAEPATPAER